MEYSLYSKVKITVHIGARHEAMDRLHRTEHLLEILFTLFDPAFLGYGYVSAESESDNSHFQDSAKTRNDTMWQKNQS